MITAYFVVLQKSKRNILLVFITFKYKRSAVHVRAMQAQLHSFLAFYWKEVIG
jgi:hypothetical protein